MLKKYSIEYSIAALLLESRGEGNEQLQQLLDDDNGLYNPIPGLL
jgi:hypothetical protein